MVFKEGFFLSANPCAGQPIIARVAADAALEGAAIVGPGEKRGGALVHPGVADGTGIVFGGIVRRVVYPLLRAAFGGDGADGTFVGVAPVGEPPLALAGLEIFLNVPVSFLDECRTARRQTAGI